MRALLVILLIAFSSGPALAQYANQSYSGYQYARPQFVPVAPTQQYPPAPYSPYFPAQPGVSSMPPGQYILTNLSTEQAIYVTITAQGQMYAGGPAPTDMVQAQQYANSALQSNQGVQQPQSKFGFLKGILQDGIGAASSMGY